MAKLQATPFDENIPRVEFDTNDITSQVQMSAEALSGHQETVRRTDQLLAQQEQQIVLQCRISSQRAEDYRSEPEAYCSPIQEMVVTQEERHNDETEKLRAEAAEKLYQKQQKIDHQQQVIDIQQQWFDQQNQLIQQQQQRFDEHQQRYAEAKENYRQEMEEKKRFMNDKLRQFQETIESYKRSDDEQKQKIAQTELELEETRKQKEEEQLEARWYKEASKNPNSFKIVKTYNREYQNIENDSNRNDETKERLKTKLKELYDEAKKKRKKNFLRISGREACASAAMSGATFALAAPAGFLASIGVAAIAAAIVGPAAAAGRFTCAHFKDESQQ